MKEGLHTKKLQYLNKTLEDYVGPKSKEDGVGSLDQAKFTDIGTSVQNSRISVLGRTVNGSGYLLYWLAKICIHLWAALNKIKTSEFFMM